MQLVSYYNSAVSIMALSTTRIIVIMFKLVHPTIVSHYSIGTRRSYACAVGRITISFTSISAGCSIRERTRAGKMSIISCQSSTRRSSKGETGMMPALLTRTSEHTPLSRQAIPR